MELQYITMLVYLPFPHDHVSLLSLFSLQIPSFLHSFLQCPLAMEERESSEIRSGSASMLLNAGHDSDLDLSIPNTYRAPPTPLPYDMVFRCPQSKDFNSIKETICGCSFKTSPAAKIVGEPDNKSQDSPLLGGPPRKLEHSKLKGNNTPTLVAEEEDVCPICLEGELNLNQLLKQLIPFCIIFFSTC